MLQKGLYFLGNRYYNVFDNIFRRSINMATVLNYQLTIFGTYSIEPSPDTITLLMNAINKATGELFLPNLISGQQVEIPSNRITTISNLGYVTQNQKYNISILNERIDINYHRVDNSDLGISDFYQFAVKALSAIMQECSLKSNRLAANIQVLANAIHEPLIPDLGKKLVASAEYYDDKPFVEWSTRINSISFVQIDNIEEKLNTILSINTAVENPSQRQALLYHLDINTVPQNTTLRFCNTSLAEFTTNVTPIIEKILIDVERLISID